MEKNSLIIKLCLKVLVENMAHFSLHTPPPRLTLACGGVAMNSVEDLSADCLGHAGLIYEYALVSIPSTVFSRFSSLVSVASVMKYVLLGLKLLIY